MKKQLVLAFAVILTQSAISQTLFIPGGTVGTSTTGNVGIGTSSPQSALDVNGTITVRQQGFGTAPNPYETVALKSYAADGFAYPSINFVNDWQNTHRSWINFNVRDGNHSRLTAMTINGFGNIGIGITTPSNKLTILQNSGGSGPLGTDGTGGVRIAWSSGYGVSLDAWDGNHPYWGLVKFSANTPTVVLGGDYTTGNVWFPAGNVSIGTTNNPNNYKLAVEGIIAAREVKVTAEVWSDFVFQPSYKLRTLNEVEQFIKTNNHLPEIPTEAEVKQNGIDLGEMNAKLLQKIEELTLYLIEQQKVNEKQTQVIRELEQKIEKIANKQ